jgi:ATP-dependent Clp protease ATP-binding subunit ClpA
VITQGHDVFARFTQDARKSLELALREALSLGHNYIGTEHLLLALLRQEDTLAFKVMVAVGATPDAVRNEVIRQLSGPGRKTKEPDISLTDLLRKLADHLDAASNPDTNSP